MKSINKVLLGTALAIGTLGLTATPAHAARVGIFVGVGAPAAYIPPCPGPGYAWVDGYWSGGYWNPGYWNFVGTRFVGPVVRYDRGFYPDRDFRGRGWNDYRGHDGDRDRDRFRR